MSRETRLKLRGREGLLLAASLLIALVIWFLSNLSQVFSGVVSVPVLAECNIPGHSNVSAGTALVQARCRTTGFRLLREGRRERSKQVRVHFERADMHHLDGDRFYIAGSAKNSYSEQFFGDEVQVESFVTDTLFFRFPAENHKRVPVQLSGDVSYRDQFMASGTLRLVPDSVTVYGEQARLDLVDQVSTAPLFLEDVHESQQGTVRLRRVKGVRLSDEIVSYELPVSRYVEVRSSLPVKVEGVPAGRSLQVYPSQAEVVLHCEFPVGRDPFESLVLAIDYKDFVSSISGRCIPRVRQLPAGVLDYRVVPEIFDCIETD